MVFSILYYAVITKAWICMYYKKPKYVNIYVVIFKKYTLKYVYIQHYSLIFIIKKKSTKLKIVLTNQSNRLYNKYDDIKNRLPIYLIYYITTFFIIIYDKLNIFSGDS